jgi:hypothetical protein
MIKNDNLILRVHQLTFSSMMCTFNSEIDSILFMIKYGLVEDHIAERNHSLL